MKDKCCRHKRLLSHDCVKCIKYKDSKQLKLSMLMDQLKLSMLIEVILLLFIIYDNYRI